MRFWGRGCWGCFPLKTTWCSGWRASQFIKELISFHCRTEKVLDNSGISIAPPKRTQAQEVKSVGPSVAIRTSTRLRVKENSDAESSESSSEESGESGEEGNESGEEGSESGEEIEKSGEEMEESGEEIEGEEVEVEVEVEVEGIEVDEVESPGAHVGPDTIDSGGLVGSDGSGPVGPAGSAGPASITGSPGAKSVVPVVSILPPTPVKNKGKGKGTPDDNQEEMLQNPPDFNPDLLMVDNDGPGGLKHGRERSGTGDVRGSKIHCRSASHSTAPTVPSTEDDDVDDDDDVKDLDKIHPDVDDDDVEDLDEIDPQGSSRSTGGFSRGRAAGNNFNWGDADDIMDPPDWNTSTYGKVLLSVNRGPEASPYMSFSTETTSELLVVLKELSGRFSPIQRGDSQIYVFQDETWEVKG